MKKTSTPLGISIPQGTSLELAGTDSNGKHIYRLVKESWLEEVEKRYPVGTKFIPSHCSSDTGKFCIITEDSNFFKHGSDIYSLVGEKRYIEPVDGKYGNSSLNRIVFRGTNNKWAEVIKKEEEKTCKNCNNFKIMYNTSHPCFTCNSQGESSNFESKNFEVTESDLEKAKELYTHGTIFRSMEDHNIMYTVQKGNNTTYCGIKKSSNKREIRTSIPKHEWELGSKKSNPLIYRDGKWAEILLNPQVKFKKGDWVIWMPTGQIGQIEKENMHDRRLSYVLKSTFNDKEYSSCYHTNLKLATPCQIDNYLRLYNKKWNSETRKIEELSVIDSLVENDCFICVNAFGRNLYGVFKDKSLKTSMVNYKMLLIGNEIKTNDYASSGLKYTKITREELNHELSLINKIWDFEKNELKELKYLPQPGDCFMFTYENYNFYGVCKTTNKSKIQCYIAIGIGRSSVNDWYSLEYDFVKIEPQVINDQLARFRKKWNFELNILENLDKFSHLPQKFEDLIIRTENKTIKEIEDQIEKAPTISKYAKAIHVQPRLLQLYEAWKDDNIDYTDGIEKCRIRLYMNTLILEQSTHYNELFTFSTKEKAERFLELFRPLLEEYKPLMGEN